MAAAFTSCISSAFSAPPVPPDSVFKWASTKTTGPDGNESTTGMFLKKIPINWTVLIDVYTKGWPEALCYFCEYFLALLNATFTGYILLLSLNIISYNPIPSHVNRS
jgi:hypothetical protein